MDGQMHYQGDPTMIKVLKITRNVTVLPEHLFARTTVTIEPQHRQDEERLKLWIDPHQLKQLNGVWYKEG
jgi:hypothetical protein